MELKSINPATGVVINTYKIDSKELVLSKIDRSQRAFTVHKKTSFISREKRLNKLSLLLKKNKEQLADLMTSEMGKTKQEALAEVEKCALVCDYYVANGQAFLKEETRVSDASKSYIKYEPLGVLLAVMPWNFPFWQVFRFAVPAILAGNTVLLKHASNVTGCSLAISLLFKKAGFDSNEFQSLIIPSSLVADVITNKYVKAVTLTGSEYAGSQVASLAGKEIKKVVLELGGSDPFLVFADADLEKASQEAINARFLNCGQSCIAGKRFLIESKVYDEFLVLFKAKLDKLTGLAPMANSQLADDLHQQVQKTVALGASLYGGNRGGHAFLSAGILSNIPENSPAFKEELFGPIASIYRFETKEEAVELANCTPFGLGSSVWTRDSNLIDYMIANIDAGAVFINSMVKSDPRLPFGGIKKSGYGRELSKEGIREFTNIKTVYIS